ncbi:hypothetical protein PJF60_05870 [Streptococcus thermophilus]|nr:hypothetical protein [Streptococcus thermophilus]MDA5509991.1 hypothetical protein [Streptococcus thermophilus]MDA5540115.1 hypothetical protein [Streptococcus thermophilus]MDA5551310.1 hypothetical protein [Streptococcus thermophilus]
MWYAKKQVAGTADENLPILSTAAPFKAGTRGDASYYTDIPAGPLAIKNVVDLYLLTLTAKNPNNSLTVAIPHIITM